MAATFATPLLVLAFWIVGWSPERKALLDLPTAHAFPFGEVNFYGEAYEGDIFVWCLDTSASMGWGGELERLREETASAILELSSDQQFSLVAFSDDTQIWSTSPRRATWSNKFLATDWLNELSAAGWTCLGDGLVKSIGLLPTAPLSFALRKVVILAGDDVPFCNGLSGTEAQAQTLLAASTANWFGAEIHGVLLGSSSNGAVFYRELARRHGGTFQQVPALPPIPPSEDPNYEVEVSCGSGSPGQQVPIPVLLNFQHGRDLTGFTLGVCHDSGLVDVACTGGVPNDCVDNGIIVEGADLMATNGGTGAAFFAPSTTSAPLEGWIVGVLVDLAFSASLPAQDNSEIVVAVYSVCGQPGDTAILEVCETGSPIVPVFLHPGEDPVRPVRKNGEIQIPRPLSLKRGDCDGSQSFDISDPIFLLGFSFTPNHPVPPCLEACDADDNTTLAAIPDALFMLNCLFLSSRCPSPDCRVDSEPVKSLGCARSGC